MARADHDDDPDWLTTLVPTRLHGSDTAALEATVAIAEASVQAGGGPFGALIVNAAREVVSAGWNQVVVTRDSTAHAEVVALRLAQARLDTHDLSSAPGAPFTLYASCAPCIQCFGAIYWSGVSHVIAGAEKGLAEAVGFQEGPVSAALWDATRTDKGVTYILAALPDALARRPFHAFRALGGAAY